MSKMNYRVYQNYATEAFLEAQKEAKKFKENWERKNDPILQRGDEYRDKHVYTYTPEKRNYLRITKENNDKLLNRSFIQKSNPQLKESEFKVQRPGLRIVKNNINHQRDTERKYRSGIRTFTQKNQGLMQKVLEGAPDCPVYRERPHVKKDYDGQPTKDYIMMNKKKAYLHHQIFEKRHLERELTPSSFNKVMHTAAPYAKNEDLKVEISTDTFKPRSEFLKDYLNKKVSIAKVLSYEDGPKYREQKYTENPNLTSYETLVNKIREDQKSPVYKYESFRKEKN